MDTKKLEIMAISAPHWVKLASREMLSLNSITPFSLQNATRFVVNKALNGQGNVGQSNWATQEGVRNSVTMMEYFEDEKDKFIQYLKDKRPNVIFIGSMTLAFAGAIKLAEIAKEVLGENVIVVLGGKHINETFFAKNEKIYNSNASPLRLMQEEKIKKIFDIICSGESEELLFHLLEFIGEKIKNGFGKQDIILELDKDINLRDAKGRWLLGYLVDKGIREIKSQGIPINYNEMPVPAEIFGIKSNFPIFGTKFTAHAFSDTSTGCTFSCFFCSESFTMGSGRMDKDEAASRIYRQFRKIKETAQRENNTDSISVFVEDSTFLGTSNNSVQLEKLAEFMKKDNFNIKFGVQFTVDQLLNPKIQKAILDLKVSGLEYVFTGMETEDENLATKMSKNIDKRHHTWLSRNEQAILFLKLNSIKYGVATLFGLGETQETRIKQLQQIKDWQQKYGLPNVVSMNLATRHPLRDLDSGEEFIDWGTDIGSPYLPKFQKLFGESSERYRVTTSHFPTLIELEAIEKEYKTLEINQEHFKEIHRSREINNMRKLK